MTCESCSFQTGLYCFVYNREVEKGDSCEFDPEKQDLIDMEEEEDE